MKCRKWRKSHGVRRCVDIFEVARFACLDEALTVISLMDAILKGWIQDLHRIRGDEHKMLHTLWISQLYISSSAGEQESARAWRFTNRVAGTLPFQTIIV